MNLVSHVIFTPWYPCGEGVVGDGDGSDGGERSVVVDEISFPHPILNCFSQSEEIRQTSLAIHWTTR